MTYMGVCRVCSVLMIKTTMQFPNTAMAYIESRGKPIQKWASSSPGIPISTKVACVKLQELIAGTKKGALEKVRSHWQPARTWSTVREVSPGKP